LNSRTQAPPLLGPLDRILLAGIVSVACLLRLWDLSLISITADEGLHGLFARLVSQFDFERYPVVGLPSVGVRNSAFFIYLLAIPNFIVRHPLSGAALIALMQVAAIVMTYRFALRWFGRTTAIIASLLWTCSPWAVIYARNMWPPSALAPFVLLLLGAGCHWYMRVDRLSLGWTVFLAMFIPQVHFSGFCAPVWAAILVLLRVQTLTTKDWRTIAGAFSLGLAAWLPWIYWQHYENGWQDLVQIGTAASGKKEFSALALVQYFRDLLHTSGFGYWFRTPESELTEFFPRWLAPARLVVGYAMEAAFFVSLFFAGRLPVGRLLILWTFLPIVLLLVLRPLVHPHYVFLAYPAPFLIIGVGARSMLNTGARKKVSGAVLTGVLVVFVSTLDGWRRYVAAGRLDGDDRYQLSYRQRVEAVRSAIDDSAGIHVEIAGPFSGQQPAYMLPFAHEIERRSGGRWPKDVTRVYWMDELKVEGVSERGLADLGGIWPYLKNIRVERTWKVGPTRILRLVGTPGAPPMD
jgi:hypothetical protein